MKYKLKKDSTVDPTAKSGDIVFSLKRPDYGLASDDSRFLGYECVSVTKNEAGDYPFFVVPRHDLELIKG